MGERRGVEFAPVVVDVADDPSSWRAEVPGRVEATAEGLTGPTGRRVQTVSPPGGESPFQEVVATWGVAATHWVNGFGYEWTYPGKSSKHIPFDWSGP